MRKEQTYIDAQEKRRLQLNEKLLNNERLKLKLSKKNYKKLKKFEIIRKTKLVQLIEEYSIKIIEAGITPEGEEAVGIFNKYDRDWRNFMRFNINKIKLHSKVGIQDILSQFSEQVNRLLDIKNKPKANTTLPKENILKLVECALKCGANKEAIQLTDYPDYATAIKNLKSYVPRGHKGEFDKMVNKVKKSLS